MQTQAFNIVLPIPLVRQVDKVAESEYRSRSDFIRQVLVEYLAKRLAWTKIVQVGRKIGREMGIKSEADADRIFFEYRHGKRSNTS
ncbi:ribbon-helix-helix protein, CopG family [Candidatus Gottesmanbacteria bacterium]|nr:ribbon-helix-helix protein, CopG family [Candidatus Gottesmanbacteria bacterium]